MRQGTTPAWAAQRHALAYNLDSFLRTLATPDPIKDWSLMSLKEQLIKIIAKLVRPRPFCHLPGVRDGRLGPVEFEEARMGRFLSTAFVVGVTACLLWALPAAAQRRGDREVRNPPTANQLVDQADSRIAALKADLHLTPDQDKNWGGFQSALHDIAVKRADEWINLRKQRTVASGETPETPAATNAEPSNPPSGNAVTPIAPTEIQALRDEADRLNRRAEDLKKIADAAQPLYASLDDPQRRQLMTFIRSNEARAQSIRDSDYRGGR
jgi:hypothetical protein